MRWTSRSRCGWRRLRAHPTGCPEAELVLDVDGAIRVVRQLLLRDARRAAGCRGSMPRSTYHCSRVSIQYWCHSGAVDGSTKNSISICSNSRVRKMKLPGVISLRKLLPIWPMPNGGLRARRRHHVGEVDEDALRGLGPQVVHALLGLDRAEVGLEHHVEVARLGPLALGAAVRADDLGHRHGVGVVEALLQRVRLLQVILPMTLVAVQALDQRVVEHLDVPGGHPHLARQDDRAVQADDVVAAGDHRPPPLPLDVLLELDAERAVVPRRLGAAVDLAGLVDEATAFRQVRNGVDDGCHG